MGRWNGADDRAVVPTKTMMLAREVLSGSPHLVLSSPGALCVGLYMGDRVLPLRYVAPQVAKPGVLAGWYAAAIPGSTFAVAVTPTMQCSSVVRGLSADDIVADVRVRGVLVNPRGRVMEPAPANDYVASGFMLQRTISPEGVIKKTEREFMFTGDRTEVRLSLRGATRGELVKQKLDSVWHPRRETGTGKRQKAMRRCRTQAYVLEGLWDLPSQTVMVQLCTPEWLKKRGILEEEFEFSNVEIDEIQPASEVPASNGKQQHGAEDNQIRAAENRAQNHAPDNMANGAGPNLGTGARVNGSRNADLPKRRPQ